MADDKVVELIGSDGRTYRGILHTVDDISGYETYAGVQKNKATDHYYELDDGRIARKNRFGQFQIDGTAITLRPIGEA